MWRRVASQSPRTASGSSEPYVKAFSALGQMLRDGRSLSGHERNCLFLNTGKKRFATVSAASGLDFADDGRAIGISDWDNDGDLDLWFSNRTSPRLRLMRNETRSAARSVSFRLEGVQCNRDAIGARLTLHVTDQGKTKKLTRTVRAGSGFLSQASKRIHFGIGNGSIISLVIQWPNGTVDTIENIDQPGHYDVKQGSGQAIPWHRSSTNRKVHPTTLKSVPVTGLARVIVMGRLPLPSIDRSTIQQSSLSIDRPRATLVNLWSTTCAPCLTELEEFSIRQSELAGAGIRVLALNVDELPENPTSDFSRSQMLLQKIQFPFEAAAIDEVNSGLLDMFHQSFLSLRRPLPLPSSFLTTPDGRVVAIYRGVVSVDQLMRDVELVEMDARSVREYGMAFDGRWLGRPVTPSPKRLATALMRNGYLDHGAKYLEEYIQRHLADDGWGPRDTWPAPERLAELCDTLADFYRLQNERQKVVGIYQVALRFNPDFIPSLVNLGKVLVSQRDARRGLILLEKANRVAGDDPVVATDLGIAYVMTGQIDKAEKLFLNVLKSHGASSNARLHLGRLYFQTRRYSDAALQLHEHLQFDSESVEALRNLAWILLCSPNDSDRNAQRAEQLMAKLELSDPVAGLDLRAALLAGRFEFAVAVADARKAIELAEKNQNPLVSSIRKRLELYQADKQFVLPSGH